MSENCFNFRKKIESDSLQKAWDFYEKCYNKKDKIAKSYNLSYPVSCEWKKDKYVIKSKSVDENRLFALDKKVKVVSDGEENYKPGLRLAGECDFNFNEKKQPMFKNLIDCDLSASDEEKDNAIKKLKKCSKMHHTLLNFSLMQVMGNMQGFKGSNRFDRLDTFLYNLNQYFCGKSGEVIINSSEPNQKFLIKYLNTFTDIYDYCNNIYFLQDKNFVDEIIRQGSLPISNVEDLMRYMELAETYWDKRETEIRKLLHPQNE